MIVAMARAMIGCGKARVQPCIATVAIAPSMIGTINAAPLLRECLGGTLTQSQFRYVQSALAAVHGFVDLAFVIEALDTCFTCPTCQTSVAVMESRLNLHHLRPKGGGRDRV